MSASTHEAVLGGARWRLTLHPDGRWDVQQRTGGGRIWDDCASGNGGLPGLCEEVIVLRAIGRNGTDVQAMSMRAGADVLQALADVAERSTT